MILLKIRLNNVTPPLQNPEEALHDLPLPYPLSSSPTTLSLTHYALAILAILLFLIHSGLMPYSLCTDYFPKVAASTSNSLYKYHALNQAYHEYPIKNCQVYCNVLCKLQRNLTLLIPSLCSPFFPSHITYHLLT